MPPDTIYIPGGQDRRRPPVILSWIHLFRARGAATIQLKNREKAVVWNGRDIFLMLILGIVLVMFSKGAELIPAYIRRKWRAAKINKLVSAKGAVYHNWLLSYNPYYRSLPDEARSRFLQRTIDIHANAKEFRFHSMEPRRTCIPVLISGAAVQLTFGLRRLPDRLFSDVITCYAEGILW